MLVLRRNAGQSVVLDDVGTVKVTRVGAARVRLELNMPYFDIFRDDIVDRRIGGNRTGVLVLDRFAGQSLEVCRSGHTIGTIHVVRVQAGGVCLGFDFPGVPINRKELVDEARISDARPSVPTETQREGVVGE